MQEEQLKNKLIKAFSQLDLDNQRNEFSNEMIVISSLLNTCLLEYGENINRVAWNYNPQSDSKMSEQDILITNYSDIIDIKNNLLLLLAYMKNK